MFTGTVNPTFDIKAIPIYLVVLIMLVCARLLGPVYFPSIKWNGLLDNILDASIVFTTAVLISNRLVKRIKNVQLRRVSNQVLFSLSILLSLIVFFDFIVSTGITFGLIGFALTLVFQAPILSFAAWVYILVSKVYVHGDRIRVGDFKGDVVDIDFFRTKILEVGGEYISSDVPSGRVVYFPNSLVLTSAVFNYTKNFKYIWKEIAFTLTYESDIKLAKRIITDVVNDYLEDDLETIQMSFEKGRDLLAIEKKFRHLILVVKPVNSWVEVRAIFVVDPRTASEAITKVTENVLEEFKKYPKKIRFPIGRNR